MFGPSPRDYRTEIPRKVRQLARKSAMNARAREGAVHVIERLAFRAPKTAQLAGLLGSLGLGGRKALVLTAGHNPNAYLSGRNLPRVEVMAYPEASAYDILWSDVVVVEEGALTGVMPEPLADEPEGEATQRAERTAQRRAAGKAKTAKKSAAKAAKKAARPAAKAKAAKHAPSKSEGKTTARHVPSKSEGKAAGKPAKKAKPKRAPGKRDGKKGSS